MRTVVGLSVMVDDPGCQFCGGVVHTELQSIVSLK